MGACVPECARNYLFDDDINIKGNKIFKKINTNLNIKDMKLSKDEKKSIDECSKLLQEAENSRIKISKKFENFLYNTGACVLTRPTMERGLVSYIINILTQIYISANKKRELDLSVYTSMLGLDLFIRRSTNDFRIRSWKLGDNDGHESMDGIPFNGLNVSITGLNAYYITNHRKFSYPAVFSQSTCQRKSAGSFMFGGGYTNILLTLTTINCKRRWKRLTLKCQKNLIVDCFSTKSDILIYPFRLAMDIIGCFPQIGCCLHACLLLWGTNMQEATMPPCSPSLIISLSAISILMG